MIIGAGFAKGQRLKAPRGELTRPASAKVRAAVLNSLAAMTEGARVLDLFAGTGSYGLEALSRGASSCVFVERDPQAARLLKENVTELLRRAARQSLAVPETRVVTRDVVAVLAEAALGPFDLVFCDPPYAETAKVMPAVMAALATKLTPGGRLVVESAASGESLWEEAPGGAWRELRKKCYGDTMITIWELDEEVQDE